MGRRVSGGRNPVRDRPYIDFGSEAEMTLVVLSRRFGFSRIEAHVHHHGFLDAALTLARMSIAVAPGSIFRQRLGASRLRSLTLTATRP